ncbi:hypothetical protein BIT17_1284 [Mycobacterium tuberculosis variant bovis]|nr:hypothetical protein BIT17_1284 [Mycobacterium tuberculosis variant bovis]
MRSRWGPLRSRAVGPSSATMRSRWGPLRSRAVGPSSATMRIPLGSAEEPGSRT